MLRSYTNVSFINETATDRGEQKGNKYDMFRWLPGDIVRPQMFEEDLDHRRTIPIGIVVWYKLSVRNGIGILWSSDPDSR